MEEELISQRDASIALNKILNEQLRQQGEIIERRALNAERLRLEAETKLKIVEENSKWEKESNKTQLYFTLLIGSIGAFLGWLLGLGIAIIVNQSIIGFFVVIPGMALGLLLGLALAKTRAQMESTRRNIKQKHSKDGNELLNGEISSHMEIDKDKEIYKNLPNSDNTNLSSYAFSVVKWTLLTSRDMVVTMVKSRGTISTNGFFFPINRKIK